MEPQQQVSEELIRMILQYLWQRHLAAEQQYLYWILGAPLLALFIFLILWWKHRGHASSLVEAISFFFVPRGPEKMLILKTFGGDHKLIYDYKVVKGENGYVVYTGRGEPIKVDQDPDAYAEPVSLVDARGPPGVPSPFGLFVRQLVAVYMMIAVIAIAFVNTFYTTYDPYMRYSEYLGGITWTTIDLLAFAALVVSVAWLIAVLIRALTPQTMLTTLTIAALEEDHDVGVMGLDVYSSHPPAEILKGLGREYKVVLVDDTGEYEVSSAEDIDRKPRKGIVAQFLREMVEKLGDVVVAASNIILFARLHLRDLAVGLAYDDLYKASVMGKARYQLSEEKLPRGFLAKYAGVLALIAIVGMVLLAVFWLQPTLGPTNTTTTTTGVQVITPAQPPQLTTTTTPPVTPAPGPTPPITPSGG